MKTIVILSCVLFSLVSTYEQSDIKSGRIETCRGCSLNRLPQVKQFVFNDAPNYDRIEVKFITGAVPELILLSDNDYELERINLSQLNQDECNDLLRSKGFKLKSSNNKEL